MPPVSCAVARGETAGREAGVSARTGLWKHLGAVRGRLERRHSPAETVDCAATIRCQSSRRFAGAEAEAFAHFEGGHGGGHQGSERLAVVQPVDAELQRLSQGAAQEELLGTGKSTKTVVVHSGQASGLQLAGLSEGGPTAGLAELELMNSKKYHNRQLLAARIQEIDRLFRHRGLTRTFIYHRIVWPNFFIHRRTYYRYLKRSTPQDTKKKLSHTRIADYMHILRSLASEGLSMKQRLPMTEQEIRAFLRPGQKK